MFCESSGALVPKDKAVKRFIVRNIVESAAIRDLQESCVYECACSRPTARRLPSLLLLRWRPWLECAGRGGVVNWPATAPAAPLGGLPGTTLVHNPGADLCPRALPPHSLRAAQAVPQGLLLHLRGHPLEGVPPAFSVCQLLTSSAADVPSPRSGGARPQPRGAPHPRAAEALPPATRREEAGGRTGRCGWQACCRLSCFARRSPCAALRVRYARNGWTQCFYTSGMEQNVLGKRDKRDVKCR